MTPLVRRWALRLDIVDHPDEHRKLHARVTPLGGGLAVLLGFAAAVGVVATLSDSQRAAFADNTSFVIGLSLAAAVICGIGLLDDRFELRGRQKLFGQFLAASILIGAGLCIREIQLFDWKVNLGPLAVPFTLFWLIGAINALNLIDGVDGLATGAGIVLSLSIASIAGLTGHRTEAFLALAMTGALLGFLIYNRAPASIFLGDAGSMLIGLVAGALAIRGSFKGPATAALAAPTAIWAIPIFDAVMAILRRRLTGRSIYTTDRGHLHHTLLKRGFSSSKTAILFGLLCSLTAIGAVVSVALHSELLAIASVAAVFATLIVTRSFGHHESRLLGQRLTHFVRSLVPMLRSKSHVPGERHGELRARLEGSRQWEHLWEMLAGFAERFDLHDVQLNITLPAHGEEYHASWQRKDRPDVHELWHSDIPLMAREVSIGRLRITGVCNHDSVCTWMSDLIAGLKPFEAHLLELLAECLEYSPEGRPTGGLAAIRSGSGSRVKLGRAQFTEQLAADESG